MLKKVHISEHIMVGPGISDCSLNKFAVLQAERMTQSEVANLLRTAVYIVVGIPIPAGAAAAVFFLPHSRYTF